MIFDWRVNLGELITAAGVLLTVFVMHRQNIERIQRIETKMDIIFGWFQRSVINRHEGGDPTSKS